MANLDGEKKIRTTKRDGIRQFISCIIVFLPVMAAGMASGWTSPTEKYLVNNINKSLNCDNCTQSKLPSTSILSKEEFSWVTSVLYFGGMAGSLIWNPITETFGRKIAGYAVGLLQTSAWAGILYKMDLKVLLISRFLLGLSMSGSLVFGMSYVNEITSTRMRGPMASLGALFLNAGFLLIYLSGSCFSYDVTNIICLSFPITFLLLFIRLPESPLYLLMDNQEQRARESFMWFRGNKEEKVGKEMAAIQSCPSLQSRISVRDLFTSRSTVVSVFIAMMLLSGQQLSGITIITSYTEVIFYRAGNDISPGVSAIIMGLLQLCGCCVPSLLVNKVNQKVLLVISYLLAATSLLVVGAAFAMIEKGYENSIVKTIPLIGILSYILSFTIGIATVPYTIFSRIIEPKVMSLAMSYGILASSVAAFLTAKLFFTSVKYFQYSGTFYILGLFSIIMAIYVMKFIVVGGPSKEQVLPMKIEHIEKPKPDLIIN